MIATAIQIICIVVLVALTVGSLLNISTSSHWFIRAWDFPRMQILGIAVFVATAFFVIQICLSTAIPIWASWMVALIVLFLMGWHGYRIVPYTPIWPQQTLSPPTPDSDNSLRLIISNVEMENDQYETWMRTIEKENPDVVVALEVDDSWMDALVDWRSRYPHQIAYPQDNWYGMLLASKLPIVESDLKFLVQQDIPSIHAKLRLRSGETIQLICVHPRPPEPLRDNDSSSRDAEMMVHGEQLQTEKGPVIVGGDLNDVAWSRTTRLFLRISDLLDPRRGRGFYNSFHAQHAFMRFPLDHVFHSQHFGLRQLRRLGNVGSDHFPILIELQYEHEMTDQQESLEASEADEELAEELKTREHV
ncbi:hypothetical protein Q31b_41670 [Novipirellula aureliae]|uniref:Endonuclease/exonuclease/phosphatase domain-containing protein n=1 Tax=Novipirellula aureliae TaxID=2527966 RepID=A0A5C6DS58_9BACT|nr:endonuclease/exonuclease/phosphatase family protein [Novipirellula aureliae]TWU39085.1 hypothetical protein Q31b_41670 [Novipirellula aureliae]